jgi:SAM-dependent methyltransferase
MYALSAVDPALQRALDPRPGQRVLDFGCGIGEPAISIAAGVAPRGSVLGVDLSSSMLGIARRRARERGVRNVRFQTADISRFRRRGPAFHAAVSRYGLPFVDDVESALRAVRDALGTRGRLALAVWGPAEKNDGYRIRQEAVRPFRKGQEPDPAEGPHPLRFGDPSRLEASLGRTGFTSIERKGVRVVSVYPTADTFAEATLDTSLFELASRLSSRDRSRLRERLARGVRAYRQGSSVRLPGFAWVISARRK